MRCLLTEIRTASHSTGGYKSLAEVCSGVLRNEETCTWLACGYTCTYDRQLLNAVQDYSDLRERERARVREKIKVDSACDRHHLGECHVDQTQSQKACRRVPSKDD